MQGQINEFLVDTRDLDVSCHIVIISRQRLATLLPLFMRLTVARLSRAKGVAPGLTGVRPRDSLEASGSNPTVDNTLVHSGHCGCHSASSLLGSEERVWKSSAPTGTPNALPLRGCG